MNTVLLYLYDIKIYLFEFQHYTWHRVHKYNINDKFYIIITNEKKNWKINNK